MPPTRTEQGRTRWQKSLANDRYFKGDGLLDRKWTAEQLVTYWEAYTHAPSIRVRLLKAVGVRRGVVEEIVAAYGHKMLSHAWQVDVTAIGTFETFAKENPSRREIGQIRTVLEVKRKASPTKVDIIGALKMIEAVQTEDRDSSFRALELAAGAAASLFVRDWHSEYQGMALASDWFKDTSGRTFQRMCDRLQRKGELD